MNATKEFRPLAPKRVRRRQRDRRGRYLSATRYHFYRKTWWGRLLLRALGL